MQQIKIIISVIIVIGAVNMLVNIYRYAVFIKSSQDVLSAGKKSDKNKPTKLDPEEWEVMFTHTEVGVKIIKPLRSFNEISDWIRYHHERMDGKGYYKLSGDQIPLASRIIAIADTYSAITMKRSYKDAKTHAEAVALMEEVSGIQLDKELLDIFLSFPEEEIKKCVPKRMDLEAGT